VGAPPVPADWEWQAKAEYDVDGPYQAGHDFASDPAGMGEMVEYGEELYLGILCNFFLEVIDQGGKRAVADFAFLDLQRKNGIFVVEKGVFHGVFSSQS